MSDTGVKSEVVYNAVAKNDEDKPQEPQSLSLGMVADISLSDAVDNLRHKTLDGDEFIETDYVSNKLELFRTHLKETLQKDDSAPPHTLLKLLDDTLLDPMTQGKNGSRVNKMLAHALGSATLEKSIIMSQEPDAEGEEGEDSTLHTESQVKRSAYLVIADNCRKLICTNAYTYFMVGIVIVLAPIVGYMATLEDGDEDKTARTITNIILYILVLICNIDVGLKILSFGGRPQDFFRDLWNVLDLAVCILSFIPATQNIIAFRLLRIFKIASQIQGVKVILLGLKRGAESIAYVVVLMCIVFFAFGILANAWIGENDPFHFGSLAMSMLTLLRMASFEDWTDVMYINMYGCDKYLYPDMITKSLGENGTATGLGWDCPEEPTAYGIWVSLFFICFVVISGTIILSILTGVITAEMQEASDIMHDEAKQERLAKLRTKLKIEEDKKRHRDTQLAKESDEVNEEQKKGIQRLRESASAREILENAPRALFDEIIHFETFVTDGVFHTGSILKKYLDKPVVNGIIIALIGANAVLVGVSTYVTVYDTDGTLTEAGRVVNLLEYVFLSTFTVEVVIRIAAEGRRPQRYFRKPLDALDFIVICLCWSFNVHCIVQQSRGEGCVGGSVVSVLRVARTIRVVRLVTRLHGLQVIVEGLAEGVKSLGYISVIISIFYYLMAVLGVDYFKENDPVHFGNLGTSMITLIRISTFEDWTDVMYTNMYGCDVYQYDNVNFRSDSMSNVTDESLKCDPNKSSGFILAFFFFCATAVLGGLVLLQLVVGVIITKMGEKQKIERAKQEIVSQIDEFANDHGIDRKRIMMWFRALDRYSTEGGLQCSESSIRLSLQYLEHIRDDTISISDNGWRLLNKKAIHHQFLHQTADILRIMCWEVRHNQIEKEGLHPHKDDNEEDQLV